MGLEEKPKKKLNNFPPTAVEQIRRKEIDLGEFEILSAQEKIKRTKKNLKINIFLMT